MDYLNLKNELSKSILFNLSLSSKELFHSNFLSYIIKKYPELIKKIFKDIRFDNAKIDDVYREKYNYDILIKTSDYYILVENKFKSIPDIEQLKKYEESAEKNLKNETIKYCLFSLYPPIKLSEKWTFIHYSDIISALEDFLPYISDEFIKNITSNYCKFVKLLIELYESFKINNNDSIFLENEKLTILRELRIHDLFYKFRYSDLAESIKNYLLANTNLESIYHHKLYEITNSEEQFLYYSTLLRATGLCEIKVPIFYKARVKIILGVQLHDKSFRLFVESSKSVDTAEIAQILLDNNLWFDFTYLKENGITISEHQKKEFCEYEKNFKYKYVCLENISKEKLVLIFSKYFDYIKQNQEKIIKSIKNVI